MRETGSQESAIVDAIDQIDQRKERRVERPAKTGEHSAWVHGKRRNVHREIACEACQVGGRIPAKAIPQSEAAREHVVLEHVVQADAQVARQNDRKRSQGERNQKNTEGERTNVPLQSAELDAHLS